MEINEVSLCAHVNVHLYPKKRATFSYWNVGACVKCIKLFVSNEGFDIAIIGEIPKAMVFIK